MFDILIPFISFKFNFLCELIENTFFNKFNLMIEFELFELNIAVFKGIIS